MGVENAKEAVLGFIESAVQSSIYRVPYTLAGLIRDSWSVVFTRADFDDCLWLANVIIAKLPRTHPRLNPDRYGRDIGEMCIFNADEIEPWKRRVIEHCEMKAAWQWKYRRNTDYRRYCKAKKLASAGVELADKYNLKLALPLIMYERPELLPRLLRAAELEIA